MIQCNQVSKKYLNGFEALSQINFTLEQGEMVFLTGHSGAGKSTLLKLIALLERPSAGNLIVNGKNLSTLKSREIAAHRSTLGITAQAPTLLNDRNIFENVALTLRIQALPRATIKKRVHSALDLVGLLSKAELLPQDLSGGEQQRVGIARAIVHKPKLILADEPTGHLDSVAAAEMMVLFSQLNESGVSILIATHDLALIASMKHRILMLKGGRIC
jgi:cell division transport system ATP-binding protein